MNDLSVRSGNSRRLLWLLCAMYFLFYIDRVNIATAATGIAHNLSLNATQLRIAFPAFAYPYAFFQVFGGWFGDHVGARRTLLGCGFVVAATTIATGLVAGLASLFTSSWPPSGRCRWTSRRTTPARRAD